MNDEMLALQDQIHELTKIVNRLIDQIIVIRKDVDNLKDN